jgi:nucleoside-diphosphate-sugar epimerase
MMTQPDLRAIDVRRAVKQLGTAVFADIETLLAIGVDAREFVPLDQGISETVEWYRQAEGSSWFRA